MTAATTDQAAPHPMPTPSATSATSAPNAAATSTDRPAPAPAADLNEEDLAAFLRGDARRVRILTGDRPTGPMHLGHYLGSLRNRVRLQRLGAELHVLVADYQVITDRDATGRIAENALGLVADYLACGIDPSDATIFAHSAVPALNQLMLPFLSLVSVPELERNPTVKAEAAASGRTALSGLMLTYPVHQAADILAVKAGLVPVGRDQLPHLEVTRTIARRFNDRYGAVFAEPRALLSQAPLVLGSDGHKMSKSRGNTIPLGADADATARIIRGFKTDADRNIAYDPEHRPEVSNLLLIAALCQDADPAALAEQVGSGGASTLKALAVEAVNEHLRPLRERRALFAADPGYLSAILRRGAERAAVTAEATLAEVRAAMGMRY